MPFHLLRFPGNRGLRSLSITWLSPGARRWRLIWPGAFQSRRCRTVNPSPAAETSAAEEPEMKPREANANPFVRLMQRFRIAGGECLDLLPVRLAVRSRNACRKESQHLIERPGKMNRSALRENLRVLTLAAEAEAEAAQAPVRGFRIAALQREARQHARWLGEAAGFRDLPGLIGGCEGTPNAPAPGETRASPWPQTGCSLQGVDNGCGRGGTAGKPGQDGTLGSNLGLCFWRRASRVSFPKRPCLVRFCD